ncbi:hypothetical protein [Desulfobacter latus]|uniref:Uncharacterized protein n=1 Tax=Desulfobacter latus TaxID=2292 RepID=A0A850SZR5_9BACT|nr:hypothetical protein [Desulfobacter latus]NWH04281.1 hypothetical protein [Desulfobacter latus]
MKKIMMALIAVTFMSTSAFAGEAPEFDVVGCDAVNHFNDVARDLVINNNFDRNGNQINMYSDFTDYVITYKDGTQVFDANGNLVDNEEEIPAEGFSQNAGMAQPDPCFPGYNSHLVTAYNGATFEWNIILQKKPETDLNIMIRDCVLKMNSFTPYGDAAFAGASQSGRYIMPWGQTFWMIGANPSITARAYPGEFASTNFETPFILDGRTLPGLTTVSLANVQYTSKGLWEESIAVVMPEDGIVNMAGETQYRLKQGDMIQVTIVVPEAANTVNINYGQDNVAINYVGIYGTDYVTENMCP